ncbi:MAG: hypothetical protein ACTHMR_03725, partial [Thermomicrobiales bacterium]
LSRALWDFLRLCNCGWEVRALRPTSADTVDQRAQAVIDTYLAQLTRRYGAPDVVINRLFMAAFLRGAFAAELVLDQAGRVGLDLATPDPAYIRYRRISDPVLGPVWQAGQWQMGTFVPFERETIVVIPVDPLPGSPYGRPPAAPALFPTLFLLGLLHDIRRVVAQQGYPRLDLSVDTVALRAAMPPAVQNDPAQFRQWVTETIAEIQREYGSLAPDDAYVHTSVVAVNKPVGAVDAQSLGAVDGLIKGLERMATRALKTSPLLMGIAEGMSEANANRQWEAHLQGIKAFQHLLEQLLQRQFALLLQAGGLLATVEVRFAENRAAEMLRDEQTRRLRIGNALTEYLAGWTSQDEAAQRGADKDKADAPAPRAIPTAGVLTGSVSEAAQVNPEPGANRATAPAPDGLTLPGFAPYAAGDQHAGGVSNGHRDLPGAAVLLQQQ